MTTVPPVSASHDPAVPSGEEATDQDRDDRFRRLLSLAWVPLVASLVSVVLSIGSIVIATRDPAILLLLPDQIRFVQSTSPDFAYAYLQPTFVSTGDNDRVEVIRNMRLVVVGPDGVPVEFSWDEVGHLAFNDADDSLSYQYVADAAPMLVAPTAARNPLALFQGPPGWLLEAGTYQIRLVAVREVADAPLEERFSVELTEAQVRDIADAGGARFLAVPINPDD